MQRPHIVLKEQHDDKNDAPPPLSPPFSNTVYLQTLWNQLWATIPGYRRGSVNSNSTFQRKIKFKFNYIYNIYSLNPDLSNGGYIYSGQH